MPTTRSLNRLRRSASKQQTRKNLHQCVQDVSVLGGGLGACTSSAWEGKRWDIGVPQKQRNNFYSARYASGASGHYGPTVC